MFKGDWLRLNVQHGNIDGNIKNKKRHLTTFHYTNTRVAIRPTHLNIAKTITVFIPWVKSSWPDLGHVTERAADELPPQLKLVWRLHAETNNNS